MGSKTNDIQMNKTITLAALCFSAYAVKVETGDVFSDIADWFENDFVDFWKEDFVEAFEDLGDWLSDAWNDTSDFLNEGILGLDAKEMCSLDRGRSYKRNLPDQLMT